MGQLWTRLFKHRDVRILLLGLDSAGKTTILYRLKLDEVVTTAPTIGFNVEAIQYRDLHFTAWDIGSRDKIRPLFRHYYKGADAVVFVVDSHDPERLDELNYDVIKPAVTAEELRDAVFLFLANKVDLSHTVTVEEIVDKLGLQYLKHTWNIMPVSAVSGEGLYQALDWLCTKLGSMQARKALEGTISTTTTGSSTSTSSPQHPSVASSAPGGEGSEPSADTSLFAAGFSRTGLGSPDRSVDKGGPQSPSCSDGASDKGLKDVSEGAASSSSSSQQVHEVELPAVRGDYCSRAYSAIKCFFFRSNRQGRQTSPDTISSSSDE